VLCHTEGEHIKKFISRVQNVKFHNLLLLFHFPDNFEVDDVSQAVHLNPIYIVEFFHSRACSVGRRTGI
jgi:hypothetical protein